MNEQKTYAKEDILKWLDDEAEYYLSQAQQRLEKQDLKGTEDCLKIHYAVNILKDNFKMI